MTDEQRQAAEREPLSAAEAVRIIESNWPPENYTLLRGALTFAITLLKQSIPPQPPQGIEALIDCLIQCACDEGKAEHWGESKLSQYVRATAEARRDLMEAMRVQPAHPAPPPQGVRVPGDLLQEWLAAERDTDSDRIGQLLSQERKARLCRLRVATIALRICGGSGWAAGEFDEDEIAEARQRVEAAATALQQPPRAGTVEVPVTVARSAVYYLAPRTPGGQGMTTGICGDGVDCGVEMCRQCTIKALRKALS